MEVQAHSCLGWTLSVQPKLEWLVLEPAARVVYACAGAKASTGNAGGPLPDQAVVTVLFGTEYGFSKEIAEKLAAQLSAGHKYWQALSPARLHTSPMALHVHQ